MSNLDRRQFLDDKRTRLSKLLRQKASKPLSAPLAFNQHRLWFLDQLDPGNPTFNISTAIQIKGQIDRQILARVFSRILDRHESLRTSFAIGPDGVPSQQIHRHVDFTLEQIEIGDLPGTTTEEKLRQFAIEHSQTRFDLTKPPLFRNTLIRISDNVQVSVATAHHIICDGWSIGIILGELRILYQQLSGDGRSTLPELSFQFRHFAEWQRDYLQGDSIQRLISFWESELDGAPQVLEFASDRPRAELGSTAGNEFRFPLGAELQIKLGQLASRTETSVFAALFTAYACLLRRHSGQDELLIGVPVAGRSRPGSQFLVGYFVNILPIRVRIDPHDSFQEVLIQITNALARAYEHQEMPFEKIVELSRLKRQPNRHPLVQTVFNFFNFPFPTHSPEDEMRLERLPFHPGVSRFDISLTAEQLGSSIDCLIEYNCDLFSPLRIEAMARGWLSFLREAVQNPTTEICRLPTIGADERQLLVHSWNNTATSYSSDRCLDELVRVQVDRTPEATAIIDDDGAWSFRQLGQRSELIARTLIELELPAESPIAILAPRGSALVAAMLGTMQAGFPFLPLDPSWPTNRIETILNEARAPVLLTNEIGVSICENCQSENRPRHVLTLTELLRQDNQAQDVKSQKFTFGKREPASLAYVIFTSGTTGKPKGVMIEHRSVVNVVESFCNSYRLNGADRVLQQTSIAFDVAINEIFPVLCTGGTLVIPPADSFGDMNRLVDYIESQAITIMSATPSGLTELNRRAERLGSLRLVLSGGESLARAHIDRLMQTSTVTNGYGPTETTICATCFDLNHCRDLTESSIPIGRPLPNYRVYVVDEQMELSPIGVPGELCIAGVGLARGYLHDPELTAERFVANPFEQNERMYRTGDKAVWRSDGELLFCGRIDRQVKIRGQRVELGEIEAVLSSHPDVVRAAATLVQDPVRGALVSAFATLRNGSTFRESWREYLSARLPAAMVPTGCVILETMPLTSNGKVDYERLPQPGWLRPDYAAPRNDDEQILCAIWSEALGLERVGINEDFFDLGGHSLLASRILHRIEKKLDIKISYRAFFDAPTVEQLARVIGKLRTESGDSNGNFGQARIQLPDGLDQDEFLQLRYLSARGGDGSPIVDFHGEVQLDESVNGFDLPKVDVNTTPKSVFITGATGFLGAFLLRELAAKVEGKLHCLIRAADNHSALGKLKRVLKHYAIDESPIVEKVVPVLGDLAKPNLGLGEPAFQELALGVDAIFHNGAAVNFIYPYAKLRPANVDGTKAILRLASTGRVKPVHFSSTLGVLFGDESTSQLVCEADQFEHPEQLPTGYAQSKWVAERLTTLAQSRGMPIAIYRPGRITAESRNGFSNSDDLLLKILPALIQLGSAPVLNLDLDFTPVDFIARAMTAIALQPECLGQTFHLISQPLIGWVSLISELQQFGYPLRLLPLEIWNAELKTRFGGYLPDFTSWLLPFTKPSSQPDDTARDSFSSTSTTYDCRNSRRLLGKAAVEIPTFDRTLLRMFFQCWADRGLLPRPT